MKRKLTTFIFLLATMGLASYSVSGSSLFSKAEAADAYPPKGTAEPVLTTIESSFQKALESKALQQRINDELGSIVSFIPRENYKKYLNRSEDELSAAAESIGFKE